MKLTIEALTFLVLLMMTRIECGKLHKRVIIHIPLKVKHHHHTHTVYKPIHHAVPLKLDEHEIHLIRPEQHNDWEDEYHIGNGRMVDSYLDTLSSSFPHFNHEESTEDHDDEYENFERLLKKRSKKKQKLFNNKVIGWKGRPNFDKIASEYLLHLKNHPQPQYDEYDDRYSPYDDDESHRKRK
ncbi:hypothetical protein PVAND_004546 [Polypedilum vanderplanki]|uniref:Uncharacterized protein n=1 Tax=Polypedilum vanderplanki TaxID=319348 RepID=A0A9J6BY23_POLVA|nr:hypothetical protein PVAND_004546 [Polypedilum vanderplanki]